MSTLPPALFLMGPTASGKTAVAAELIRHLPCQIISVDSALVYRHLNIGTAKPDAETLRRAPHRLIDICDPDDAYSAGRFRADALREMADISAQQKIPLLTGGTMLYFRALQQGLSELPAADPALRALIDNEARQRGWPALHAELAALDPAAAARLKPTDAQRIQRALEICRLTGRPMSANIGSANIGSANIGSANIGGDKSALPYTVIAVSLEPSDRAELHRRIARRFEQMLATGLVDELAQLRRRFRLSPTLPSMRCVGYRQAWQYLDGEIDREELRDQGIAATRQLAKRQLTWLRAMADVTRFDCLADNVGEQVRLHFSQQLAKLASSAAC